MHKYAGGTPLKKLDKSGAVTSPKNFPVPLTLINTF